jgi:hypothetical protein
MSSEVITKNRGLRQKVIFMAALIVYGLVLFSVANYLQIGVTTTPGGVVLQGFVNSRETGERLVAAIRESMGEKPAEGFLKIEERK